MDLNIAVTPRGYDDIGAVIKQLEYSCKQVGETSLYDASALSKFDVLFINCSSSCQGHAVGASKTLRQFVTDGGTIYASDHASAYITAAFPKAIQFAGRHGPSGRITAQIVDKGLRILMRDTIQLTFDLSSWEQIKGVGEGVQVYVEYEGRPILVSFEYGKGQVIYTCFHNHAQVSKQEAALLRYLVVKPLTAKASAELFAGVTWGDRSELQETVGTVGNGETSPWYEYIYTGGDAVMVMLNWKGEAHLRLEVQATDGTWYAEGGVAPLTVSPPTARSGRWQYRVISQEVAFKNFPFVVVIGPARQVNHSGTTALSASLWSGLPAAIESELLASIKLLDENRMPENDVDIRILDE